MIFDSKHGVSLEAKPGKPLWEHSIETAIMAKVLLTESDYKAQLDGLYELTDMSTKKEDFLSSILFLIALHDLGKLHPKFQEALHTGERSMLDAVCDVFRHEDESSTQIKAYFREKYPEMGLRTRNMLGRIVMNHHQRDRHNIENSIETEAYKQDVRDMIQDIDSLWHFTPFTVEKSTNSFGQIVCGTLRFSDWAASSYYQELSSKNSDYIDRCYAAARNFLRDGGHMDCMVPSIKYDYTNLCDLPSDTLYPLQRKLIDVMNDHPNAECVLIEDQPGSGKTEGAFYTATQLMQAYGHNGLYVALPTDATASEMLPRLKKCFQDHGFFQDAEAKLLTGKAWLHEDTKCTDQDTKVEWETKSRKLFAPLACGTVDQLMQVGIKLKAGDMRLLAVSNKVVIIDEFHAYDAYMMEIITTTLEWFHSMHVPVIILSATLLEETRKELFSIYSDNDVESIGYPRITCADGGKVYSYTCKAAKKKEYTLKTIQYTEVVNKIKESISTGGNTLYIANTVKKAYQMYQLLRKSIDSDITIRLYAARTSPSNKEKMGNEMVYLYGKKGKGEKKRPSKTIVVATQIMEMSVDVDFDTVFSELAPADALFQRMGRMARHGDEGTVRETGFKSVFYLVIPDKRNKWWYMPYAECVLSGTEKIFSKSSIIKVPEDIPRLLEASYKEAGEDWKEEALRLSALGSAMVIDGPDAPYEPKSDYISLSECSTRYQEEGCETETIICIPEGASVADTREWARDMIWYHSVTIPKRISEKIEGVFDTSKCKWLNHYKVVIDEDCFWGPDGQFVFGL